MRNDRFSYDGWDERKAYLDAEKNRDRDLLDRYSCDSVGQYPVMFHDDGYGKYLETSHDGLYGIKVKDEYVLDPSEIRMKRIYIDQMNRYNRAINDLLWVVDPLMRRNNCRDTIINFINKNKDYLRQCIRFIPVCGSYKQIFGNEVSGHMSYNIEEVKRFIALRTNSVLLNELTSSKSISVISFTDVYFTKSIMKDIRAKWKSYNPFDVYAAMNSSIHSYIQTISKSNIVDNIILNECGNIRKNISRKYDDTIKGVRSNTYKFQYTRDCTLANLLSLLVIAKRVQQTAGCWSVTLTIQINDIQYVLHDINLYYDVRCERYDRKLNKYDYTMHFNGISQLMYIFWYISSNAPSILSDGPIIPMLVNFSWNKRPIRCFK